MVKFYILCSLLGLTLMSCKNKEGVIELSLVKHQDTLERLRSASGFLPEGKNPVPGAFPQDVKGMSGWNDSLLYFYYTDFPQLLFQAYKAGKVTEDLCMEYFNGWGYDTTVYSSKPVKACFAMLMAKGADGRNYFIADENGNLDFSDDMPRLHTDSMAPVRVLFERNPGRQIVVDSSWIFPGKREADDYLFVECREMTTASFFLHGKPYTCHLFPSGVFYDRQRSVIEIVSPDTTIRCQPHEYLQLDGEHYYADSVSSDGRYLRLTPVPHPEKIETTQEGFPPFSFTATTTEGKIIHFPDDFKGKYVLLDFWSVSCGPCVQEIREHYPDLYARYKDKGFEILGVADNTNAQIARFSARYPLPWLTIADRENERKLQKLYNISSYPSLFLIDDQGKIAVKGEGSELRGEVLKQKLKKIFNDGFTIN